MTPLLQAAKAAQAAGLDAPQCLYCWDCPSCGGSGIGGFESQCVRCVGTGRVHVTIRTPAGYEDRVPASGTNPECKSCRGTGIANDPPLLAWAAFRWIWDREKNVVHDEFPNISAAIRDAETGCGMRGFRVDHHVERHDGSAVGMVVALLGLVVKVDQWAKRKVPASGPPEALQARSPDVAPENA